MPSVIKALHWLLLAENKPNLWQETLWSFSSLKISNTSCVLFFHNFFKTLQFQVHSHCARFGIFVLVPEKLGNIKGVLEPHVLQLEQSHGNWGGW